MGRYVLGHVVAALRATRDTFASPPLTELPLHLPGRLYRAAMPFSVYDRRGRLLPALRARAVSLVVLLAEPDECRERTGRDLLSLYAAAGFDVLHVPAPDFGVPPAEALRAVVARTLTALRAGTHVAAHCHAGQGRTGVFAACLAHECLGLDAAHAIAWVRRLVPGAVEMACQQAAVHVYCASRSADPEA